MLGFIKKDIKSNELLIQFHKYSFLLLVFLFPSQLAYHFWPKWAHLFGIRIDYLAPTVYLTDMLMIFLVFLWLVEGEGIEKFRKLRKKLNKKLIIYFTLAFCLLVLVNIYFASFPIIAFLKWVNIFKFGLFIFYIKSSEKLHVSRLYLKPLIISVVFFSGIAFAQFYLQRSVGGILYFLGERTFNTNTVGIALGNILGQEFLRPYSTFPHPNSLAGYVLVSIFLIVGKNMVRNFVKLLFLGISLLVIFISFSKTAIITLVLLALFYFFFKKNSNKKSLKKAILVVPVYLVVASLSLPFISKSLSSYDFNQSIKYRYLLSEVSGKIIAEEPLYGAGLNHFILEIPEKPSNGRFLWWLQPVHNVYLLVFSETGIVGLLLLFLFLFYILNVSLRKRKYDLVFALLAIMITSLADHYWFTLQQNQLIASLVVGLTLRNKR